MSRTARRDNEEESITANTNSIGVDEDGQENVNFVLIIGRCTD